MIKKKINNFYKNFPFEKDVEPVRWYPCDLKAVNFDDVYPNYKPVKNYEPLALYIYIPFCWHKCSYCPFFSFVPNEDIINKYLVSLHKELEILSQLYKDVPISAVWIGGGTASLIGSERINKLTELISNLFNLKDNCEFTLEGIPGDLNRKQLDWLAKNSKINRISFGVQSFNNKFLKILDRPKGANKKIDIIRSINNVKNAGLDISIDLMYRLPGQTVAEWKEDLKIAVNLGVDHLLAPSFLPISGTKINQMMDNNQLPPQPDLKIDGLMYFAAKEFLESHGYIHYTNWHYAKPNKKSLYISLRWLAPQGNYISAGAGAFSFNENWLYCNVHNVKDYITCLEQEKLPVYKGIHLDRKEKMARFMVLGLRGFSVKNSDFKKKFGKTIKEVFPKEMAFLNKYKLITNLKGKITLTLKGEYFANNISKIFYTKNQKGAPQLLGNELAKNR